jgi:predicted metal-dependent HD superfamily phosphohydrolase
MMGNSNFISWLVIAMFFIALVMGQRWTDAARLQLERALETSIRLEEERHAATLRHQATIIQDVEELKAMFKAHDSWQSGMVKGGPQSRPYKGPPQ